jgi:hypothetical protein
MSVKYSRPKRYTKEQVLSILLAQSSDDDTESSDNEGRCSDTEWLPSCDVSEPEDNIVTDFDKQVDETSEGDNQTSDVEPSEDSGDEQRCVDVVPKSSGQRGRLQLRGQPARRRRGSVASRRGRGTRGRTRSRSDHNNRENCASAVVDRYVAKSGRVWSAIPARKASTKRAPKNIVRCKGGVVGAAKDVSTIRESFELFIDKKMLDTVVNETNNEGQRVFGSWNQEHVDMQKIFQPTTAEEMSAYIGLLLLRGVCRSHGEPLRDLWKPDARPAFRAAMSRNRFQLLTRLCRFDDKDTRDERRAKDKFAPIRELFDEFMLNCHKHYSLSESVTIDETLRKFRGRCPFRMYMPQKPGKYGILFRVISDAQARYVSKMIRYVGRIEGQDSNANSAAQNVRDLTDHIRGSGRNVTIDRYYTTVEQAEEMVKERNLTVVGTLQSNRKGIPDAIKSTKDREIHSTMFGFSGECMLLSYIPKKGKVVLMLSTEHDSPDLSTREDRKPQVILDYSAAKGGVDTVDMMIDTYRSKVATRRWPMVVWTTMIDVAALNGFLIWLQTHPDWGNGHCKYNRAEFLKQLAYEMILPHVQSRSTNTRGLTADVVMAISSTLGRNIIREPISSNVDQSSSTAQSVNRGRCCVCIVEARGTGYKQGKYNACKVRQTCDKCYRNVCMKHSTTVVTCLLCDGISRLE